MKPIDQIGNNFEFKLKGTHDGVGVIEIGNQKFLTDLDENVQPFTLNGEPIITDIDEKMIINTGIINLVNNNGPHSDDLRISSKCTTKFNIIVENNRPFIVTSSYCEEFLVLQDILNKHLVLSNSGISHVVDKSLAQIETDVYISEKNNDFAVGLNIYDGKYYLYLKNENGYEKVDLTSINKENKFPELLDVPSKDTMSVIGGRVVAFNEEKKVFYEIELPFEYKNAKFSMGEYTVSASSNGERFSFTASRENSKEPNILDLNGTKLLLSDKNETGDNKGNEFYTIIPGLKKSQKDMIYFDDYFEIEGVKFYNFGINNKQTFAINNKQTFTDGKDVYSLDCDTEGKVKLVNFEGKEYPFKILDSYSQNYTEVLDNSGGKLEFIPTIKKTIVEEIDGKEEIKEIYERLKFDDEQKKLNIVGIFDEHGIVCLASDVTNTSRFRFYRVNHDNTLTYVFSNNYEIYFDEEKKLVRLTVAGGGDEKINSFELVRKSNSSSILDPILINGKEYYLVKIKDGKTRYIKVNSRENGFEFSLGEFEVDNDTLLPVQSQSFELNSKTIYLKENGIVVIGEESYQLCDVNGENTNRPENSIILVGNIRVLLLKKINDSLGYIYGYAEGNKISADIEFRETDSIGSNTYNCPSGIKKINIGGKECICLYYYREQNIILIVEDREGKLSRRYLYGKVSEGEDNDNKIIKGEEYKCNGTIVLITEILGNKYVEGENGTIYYIKGQGKELKQVTLLDNIEVGNGIYCDPKNYDYPVVLKTSKGEAVKLKGQENLYYTDKETHTQKITINGVNCTIYTFFNASENRLEQFKKVGEEYQPFCLGGTKNVLLIDNYLMIWLHNEKEPREMINVYYGIIQATTRYNEKVIFVNEDNDAKFKYGINGVTGDRIIYAVRKVGNNYFAVSCKEKGYNLSIEKNGDIKLDGIMYGEEKIEALYNIMTNDIGVPEIVLGVSGEVGSIIK